MLIALVIVSTVLGTLVVTHHKVVVEPSSPPAITQQAPVR